MNFIANSENAVVNLAMVKTAGIEKSDSYFGKPGYVVTVQFADKSEGILQTFFDDDYQDSHAEAANFLQNTFGIDN